ncbi:hypothetical protein [Photobacterium indicum]|nr:hypothetical protein [Photobacterium indicum]
MSGMASCVALYLFLDVLSFVFNIPQVFMTYDSFDFYSGLSEARFFDFRLDMLIIGFLSVAYSLVAGIHSKRKMKVKEERLKEMRKIANSDLMEKVFFDAMTRKMLVLVSLSSRKVYVGMAASTRIEHGDFENVEIIPIMSGYRDKDTLVFKEVHSYINHYKDNDIGPKSKPLSIYDFRNVIPTSQIESVSLFDPATFDKFQGLMDSEPKELDKAA